VLRQPQRRSDPRIASVYLPEAAAPLTIAGATWEIRFTERAMSDQTRRLGHRTAVIERARATLSTIDPHRPLAEQAERGSNGTLTLGSADQLLTLWPDDDATYWITAVGEDATAQSPTELDRWRRSRDRLARLIAQIRIVAPLLHRRVLDSGEPASVEVDESLLGVGRSADAIRIQFAPPPWCSPGEARRLAAVVAACITPVPGWHLVRSSDEGQITAVLPVNAKGTEAQ
jgi:hypothetical protein